MSRGRILVQLLERGHLSICTFFILPPEEGREIDKLDFRFSILRKLQSTQLTSSLSPGVDVGYQGWWSAMR